MAVNPLDSAPLSESDSNTTANTRASSGELSSALLTRYAGPCPRYTSYPTADRFTDLSAGSATAAGADARKPWDALQDINTLSLYVHIPFCRSLCYFCACNKVITQQYGLASSYLDRVLTEAQWYREKVARVPVTQLHLGGGTPTYLNDGDLTRLVQGLGDIFDLNPGGDVEYSVEADPRVLEPETLDTLRGLGFNRLSMGIQDFNPEVQRAINRICSPEQVRGLTEAARERGFGSISYDLIYGLPGQDVASLERTIDTVVELAPDRIALYHYAHLPHRFKAQRLISSDLIPPPQAKIDMQLAATRRLTDAGYQFLGMDHFARPDDPLARATKDGRLARNFQGYTLMPADALVGLGASAISYSRDGYWQNHHGQKEYATAIGERGEAICRGWQLDTDDRVRQWVIMELMCHLRLDKREVERRLGSPFEDYFAQDLARLRPLVADGLVLESREDLVVSERGRWFLRNIAAAFDRHLHAGASAAQYSRVL
ncbi:oxygen-independent coproporphyrinogen III oxidase [Microbulbifer hydrolyticus]|uniref:Coproporphyrinogen-III oxidase n=1 Tax=Microbulbifer hydrolyticus TaxID=48074 RepID=A0A6P1T8N4_9GAMM|nr:oxygen-independent coproporphyrinogen III oxidase [Microbulbifer hydrolyticus]MBB5211049.1 oxygen-independent coproporphyrinogen-3 oxidase [Microbulbifer hydrolyticus]QHQ38151.1 oxygen-independent coproporphyrinogen III oxidase [Microbulbifer hydrolyticus]